MIFDKSGSSVVAAGVTTLINAPGNGLSIYMQSVSSNNTNSCLWQNSSGAIFADTSTVNNAALQANFPGGFRVGNNLAVQVNTGGALRATFTYTIGPA